MFKNAPNLSAADPEIFAAVTAENARQEAHIELIASENYTSPAVMQAQGSQLTNKYAEGYPGKRYYGGCEHVDVAETLAIERLKKVFDCDYANVQPHSGAQANAAVFHALVTPGDTVMGMNLSQGGHLTHGHPANSRIKDWARMRAIADKVGAFFWVDMAHIAGLVAAGEYPSPLPHAHVVTSTTHKTLRGPRGGIIVSKGQGEEFNKKFQSAVFPGIQGGPLMHVIAAKAVAFKEALDPSFKTYQKQVVANARAMAKVFLDRGYKVVSGGTDDHLFLLDLVAKNVTGKDAEALLGEAHITVNKNSVPNDPRSAFVTSGLRLGSPASTTRGFEEAEMASIAGWIADIVDAMSAGANVDATVSKVRGEVEKLCARFPVYGNKA